MPEWLCLYITAENPLLRPTGESGIRTLLRMAEFQRDIEEAETDIYLYIIPADKSAKGAYTRMIGFRAGSG